MQKLGSNIYGLTMLKKGTANLEDVIQVVVGASALSVPVAFSEESWNLSRSLPWQNVLFLLMLSLAFINLYSVQGIFQGNIKYRLSDFLLRTLIDYLITIVVVFIVLLALNRMPILSDPYVASGLVSFLIYVS